MAEMQTERTGGGRKNRERPTLLWRLLRTFGPDLLAHRRMLLAAYLFNLVSVGAAVLSPWPLKVIIDNVIAGRPLPDLLTAGAPDLSAGAWVVVLAFGFILLATLSAVAGSLHKVLGAKVRERLALELRDRILLHIQSLPPSILTTHRSGELVLRLVGDVNLFARLQTRTLPIVFRHLSTFVLTLSVMFWLEPRLALLSLIIVPGLTALAHRYAAPLRQASRRKRRREGEVAGLAQEIVRGLPTIQALSAEEHARRRFAATNARSLQAGVEQTRVAVGMERTLQIAQGVAVALITGGGALLVLQGQLTIGALTVFVSYISNLLKPVEKINELASALTRGLIAGEQLLSLLETRPLVQDAPHAIVVERAAGRIELRNVWFRYPEGTGPREAVLRGVNLLLEPGHLTALVGASGCGKSTILHLLLRLYEPTAGEIVLDSVPLSAISLHSVRSQFAVMLQNTHLFAGTIREAISPALSGIDDGQLWQALALVGLEKFVGGLPLGLDTELGEDGVNLSGGQRKRLSLARAFLLDRPILLLDEPLANIDAASASVIVKALDRIRQGRTCLVITHQAPLIDRADVVVRLEAGRVEKVHKGSLAQQLLKVG